jgi:aminoglycoside phosphotransferase (APT) family kinase protein
MGSRSRDGAEAVRRMVAAHLPGYRIDSVARVGEGTDNLVFEVNGELLVRWSKEADPAARAARVEREARLLAAVADISPLPVPEPSVVDPEQGCLAYRKLLGRPLLDLPDAQRSEHGGSVAATLGELLTALHAAPVEPLARLVDIDDQPLGDWRREAAETYAQVGEEVPVEYRRRVEAFLDAPPPAHEWAPPVFSHNDLGIEHVLVDAGTWNVTGVIDWSDAAIVDPAVDVGLLYRDLGPAAHAALASYRSEVSDRATLEERAVFYARCSVFEDLAYGIETGQERYVEKSLAAMAWLFPARQGGS